MRTLWVVMGAALLFGGVARAGDQLRTRDQLKDGSCSTCDGTPDRDRIGQEALTAADAVVAGDSTRARLRGGTGDGTPDRVRAHQATADAARDRDMTRDRDRLRDGTGDGTPDQVRERSRDRLHAAMVEQAAGEAAMVRTQAQERAKVQEQEKEQVREEAAVRAAEQHALRLGAGR
jgi:hypothetical protein